LWLTGLRATGLIALELWDADAWHVLASRQVQVARNSGALAQLQFALNFLARSQLLSGELIAAAVLVEEERAIAQAMGNPAVGYAEVMLPVWRGQESRASELIERMMRPASARGLGRMVDVATYAKALLYNGVGRYDAAREAARAAFEHRDHVGYGLFLVGELAEAASRTGDRTLVRAALEWLCERTQVTRTDWLLGIEARVRALLSEGDAADGEYRESIARLGCTCLRTERARGHLLCLSPVAHDGCARRTPPSRRRTAESRDDLTAQKRQIALLARDGMSNIEIGARPYGAAHASEIQYLMDLPAAAFPGTLSAAQRELATSMKGYWTNFAKRGFPSSFGSPFWRPFSDVTDRMQSLAPPIPQTESDFATTHNCEFWAALAAAG
jgi:hypothetical protein